MTVFYKRDDLKMGSFSKLSGIRTWENIERISETSKKKVRCKKHFKN